MLKLQIMEVMRPPFVRFTASSFLPHLLSASYESVLFSTCVQADLEGSRAVYCECLHELVKAL